MITLNGIRGSRANHLQILSFIYHRCSNVRSWVLSKRFENGSLLGRKTSETSATNTTWDQYYKPNSAVLQLVKKYGSF